METGYFYDPCHAKQAGRAEVASRIPWAGLHQVPPHQVRREPRHLGKSCPMSLSTVDASVSLFMCCLPSRKETYVSVPRILLPEMGEEEQVVEEDEDGKSEEEHEDPPKTPAREDSLQGELAKDSQCCDCCGVP